MEGEHLGELMVCEGDSARLVHEDSSWWLSFSAGSAVLLLLAQERGGGTFTKGSSALLLGRWCESERSSCVCFFQLPKFSSKESLGQSGGFFGGIF